MVQTKKIRSSFTSHLRGWSKQQPGYHQRTRMLAKCGKKCFLGPNKTFPICTKNTCKRNKKGILAAYVRASEYMTIRPKTRKYRKIVKKAHKLLVPFSKMWKNNIK